MSSCACGHHHHAPTDTSGETVQLGTPLFGLHGRLICSDMGQMMAALDLLPDHVALTRAEPGCLRFDITQSEDPMIWALDELFADEDAFQRHQQRTQASAWGAGSRDMGRDFHRHSVQPQIRPEGPTDRDAIDRLLTRAFDGPAEAQLVRDLRADGDLAVSLVAHAQGTIIGHVALSPLQADRPAYALAPLAVDPGVQGRGLGRALIAAALKAAGDHAVVVLGSRTLYAAAGFAEASLDSPWPGLQIHGHLPQGSAVRHARAFQQL
ncbi:GNAT family N-acetyltransferase [Paracoccus beibuensis]|uniref:GNAT family N-acetyltransferase n=1 Tax=Paracoccus beibuensis TaxID=547602 RepID=UPI00223F7888|nr:GNAT family N-acetyltransferase [Paracoccus beibuensis]